MLTEPPLLKEQTDWLNKYSTEVLAAFRPIFEAATDRFPHSRPLLKRFCSAVEAVKSYGGSKFNAVDEAHNELCIASAILDCQEPVFERLDYEMTIPGCAKSIDFRATSAKLTAYVDVKTIRPKAIDRWDQFERVKGEGKFPCTVSVIFDKDALGGELWHNKFAARVRMLEYAREFEQKITAGKLQLDNALYILALCGAGFKWHEDELEDFVGFYYSGRHRDDDPFSEMEASSIRENGIVLERIISHFACMHRPHGHILPRRLNWNVHPPRHSDFPSNR